MKPEAVEAHPRCTWLTLLLTRTTSLLPTFLGRSLVEHQFPPCPVEPEQGWAPFSFGWSSTGIANKVPLPGCPLPGPAARWLGFPASFLCLHSLILWVGGVQCPGRKPSDLTALSFIPLPQGARTAHLHLPTFLASVLVCCVLVVRGESGGAARILPDGAVGNIPRDRAHRCMWA